MPVAPITQEETDYIALRNQLKTYQLPKEPVHINHALNVAVFETAGKILKLEREDDLSVEKTAVRDHMKDLVSVAGKLSELGGPISSYNALSLTYDDHYNLTTETNAGKATLEHKNVDDPEAILVELDAGLPYSAKVLADAVDSQGSAKEKSHPVFQDITKATLYELGQVIVDICAPSEPVSTSYGMLRVSVTPNKTDIITSVFTFDDNARRKYVHTEYTVKTSADRHTSLAKISAEDMISDGVIAAQRIREKIPLEKDVITMLQGVDFQMTGMNPEACLLLTFAVEHRRNEGYKHRALLQVRLNDFVKGYENILSARPITDRDVYHVSPNNPRIYLKMHRQSYLIRDGEHRLMYVKVPWFQMDKSVKHDIRHTPWQDRIQARKRLILDARARYLEERARKLSIPKKLPVPERKPALVLKPAPLQKPSALPSRGQRPMPAAVARYGRGTTQNPSAGPSASGAALAAQRYGRR